MNMENAEKLFNEFPHLYRGRYKSHLETSMHFGFLCDDGWFDIIWELSRQIEQIARKAGNDIRGNSWPEITSIKQKVGSLRVHLAEKVPEYNRVIESAFKKSISTCEICGDHGKEHAAPLGGIKTLCKLHYRS